MKKNLREKAVALVYNESENPAPKVLARGEGHIARKIKEMAEAHGIPIRRDDDLVELLAQVELDRQIPPELFAAVAQILAWVYRANDAIRRSEDQHPLTP